MFLLPRVLAPFATVAFLAIAMLCPQSWSAGARLLAGFFGLRECGILDFFGFATCDTAAFFEDNGGCEILSRKSRSLGCLLQLGPGIDIFGERLDAGNRKYH